jgi:hypothetical protein
LAVAALPIAYDLGYQFGQNLAARHPWDWHCYDLTGDALLALIAFGAPEVVAEEAADGPLITQSVKNLRAAGLKDAHHVIQDAAVRDLPGYDSNLAAGVHLPGPSTLEGTPHFAATQVQRLPSGGTYGAERQVAYCALRAPGYSESEAAQAIREADEYFGSIGVTETTPTRIPGNRNR